MIPSRIPRALREHPSTPTHVSDCTDADENDTLHAAIDADPSIMLLDHCYYTAPPIPVDDGDYDVQTVFFVAGWPDTHALFRNNIIQGLVERMQRDDDGEEATAQLPPPANQRVGRGSLFEATTHSESATMTRQVSTASVGFSAGDATAATAGSSIHHRRVPSAMAAPSRMNTPPPLPSLLSVPPSAALSPLDIENTTSNSGVTAGAVPVTSAPTATAATAAPPTTSSALPSAPPTTTRRGRRRVHYRIVGITLPGFEQPMAGDVRRMQQEVVEAQLNGLPQHHDARVDDGDPPYPSLVHPPTVRDVVTPFIGCSFPHAARMLGKTIRHVMRVEEESRAVAMRRRGRGGGGMHGTVVCGHGSGDSNDKGSGRNLRPILVCHDWGAVVAYEMLAQTNDGHIIVERRGHTFEDEDDGGTVDDAMDRKTNTKSDDDQEEEEDAVNSAGEHSGLRGGGGARQSKRNVTRGNTSNGGALAGGRRNGSPVKRTVTAEKSPTKGGVAAPTRPSYFDRIVTLDVGGNMMGGEPFLSRRMLLTLLFYVSYQWFIIFTSLCLPSGNVVMGGAKEGCFRDRTNGAKPSAAAGHAAEGSANGGSRRSPPRTIRGVVTATVPLTLPLIDAAVPPIPFPLLLTSTGLQLVFALVGGRPIYRDEQRPIAMPLRGPSSSSCCFGVGPPNTNHNDLPLSASTSHRSVPASVLGSSNAPPPNHHIYPSHSHAPSASAPFVLPHYKMAWPYVWTYLGAWLGEKATTGHEDVTEGGGGGQRQRGANAASRRRHSAAVPIAAAGGTIGDDAEDEDDAVADAHRFSHNPRHYFDDDGEENIRTIIPTLSRNLSKLMSRVASGAKRVYRSIFSSSNVNGGKGGLRRVLASLLLASSASPTPSTVSSQRYGCGALIEPLLSQAYVRPITAPTLFVCGGEEDVVRFHSAAWANEVSKRAAVDEKMREEEATANGGARHNAAAATGGITDSEQGGVGGVAVVSRILRTPLGHWAFALTESDDEATRVASRQLVSDIVDFITAS